MLSDIQLQYVGWACTVVGGFLCGVLTFWLLRPKPKRMPEPPKPVPYASPIGARPPAPWVTREELEAAIKLHEGTLHELEGENGKRVWPTPVDWDRRLMALENQRPKPVPEPLAHGVRVWRDIENGFLYVVPPNGTDWALVHADWFEAKAAWTAAQFERHALFYTELHGHERDSVVRDWQNRAKS